MAKSRNQAGPHPVWLILLGLGLLVLAATRAQAAPVADGLVEREPEDRDAGDRGDDREESEDEAPDDPREASLRDPSEEDDPLEALGDSRAVHEDALADPDRLADLLEDASVEDSLVRDAIETGAVFSTALADAAELSDFGPRQQRPSRFGRLDLTIAWRRGVQLMPLALDGTRIAAVDASIPTRRTDDTFLVIATWRI